MAKKITIYGQEYQLTDEIENYVKVRNDFRALSVKYGNLYEKELENKCTDAKKLIEDAYDIADKYFDKAGEIILNKLVENDIYTVQLKNIKEYYGWLGWLKFNFEYQLGLMFFTRLLFKC